MSHYKTRSAFTLIELLTSISVIAILGALTVVAVGEVREKTRQAEEVSAARQLVAAYSLVPSDNQGRYLATVPSADEVPFMQLKDQNGNRVSMGAVIRRYPYRLMPYLGGIGPLYPGEFKTLLDDIEAGHVPPSVSYATSIMPAFGINADYLGGNYPHPLYSPLDGRKKNVAATMPSQVPEPSRMIAFVSSFAGPANPGYTDAAWQGSPNVYAPKPLLGAGSPGRWTPNSYNPNLGNAMGQIHLRHDDRAVVANLDGSVELLDAEQLSDMRRWSHQAQRENDKNFSPNGG